jgi:hypothetical protein
MLFPQIDGRSRALKRDALAYTLRKVSQIVFAIARCWLVSLINRPCDGR